MKIKRNLALLSLGLLATTTLSSGVLAAPAGNPPGSNTPTATFSALSVGGFSVDTFGRLAHTSGAINFLTNRISSAVGGTWALWLTNNTSSAAGTAGNLSNPTIYAENTGDSMAGYFTSPSQQPTLTGQNTYPVGTGGPGVRGTSIRAPGVSGISTDQYGVYGTSANSNAIYGAISGATNNTSAVVGVITNLNSTASAVYGGNSSTNAGSRGVTGIASAGYGVVGQTSTGIGTYGVATSGTAMYGYANSGRGLMGVSNSNDGVYGASTSGTGVRAVSAGANPAIIASASGGGDAIYATSSGKAANFIASNLTGSSRLEISPTGLYSLTENVSGSDTHRREFSQTASGMLISSRTDATVPEGEMSSASIIDMPLVGEIKIAGPEGVSLGFYNNWEDGDPGDLPDAAYRELLRITSGGILKAGTSGIGLRFEGDLNTYAIDALGSIANSGANNNGNVLVNDGLRVNGSSDLKGSIANSIGNVTVADALDVTGTITSTGTLESPTIRTASDGFRAYAGGTAYVGSSFYAQGQNTYIYGGISNPSTTVEPSSGGYVFIDDGFRVNSSVTQKLTNTAWTTWSDGRLKNIQKTFDKGLEEIMKIDPIIYKYKKDNALGIKDDGDHVGIIAQEIQKVFPEAVTTDEKGFLQFTPDSIYWAMLNAIKELGGNDEVLKAKITALEAQNKTLEARLSVLEAKLK